MSSIDETHEAPSFPAHPIEEFAEGYLRAGHLMELTWLTETDPRLSSAGAIAVVPLVALGVEVGLKALHRRHTSNIPYGHDLAALWDALPSAQRVAVRAFEEHELRDGPFPKYPWKQDFRETLEFADNHYSGEEPRFEGKSAFEVFRYRWEHDGVVGLPIEQLSRIGYAVVRYMGAPPWTAQPPVRDLKSQPSRWFTRLLERMRR